VQKRAHVYVYNDCVYGNIHGGKMRIKDSLLSNIEILKPEIRDCLKIEERSGYGFELDNPIEVGSVAREYELIGRMELKKYQGACLLKDYERQSCWSEKYNCMIDVYELLFSVIADTPFPLQFLYTVYLSAYPLNAKTKGQYFTPFGKNVEQIPLPEEFVLKK